MPISRQNLKLSKSKNARFHAVLAILGKLKVTNIFLSLPCTLMVLNFADFADFIPIRNLIYQEILIVAIREIKSLRNFPKKKKIYRSTKVLREKEIFIVKKKIDEVQ